MFCGGESRRKCFDGKDEDKELFVFTISNKMFDINDCPSVQRRASGHRHLRPHLGFPCSPRWDLFATFRRLYSNIIAHPPTCCTLSHKYESPSLLDQPPQLHIQLLHALPIITLPVTQTTPQETKPVYPSFPQQNHPPSIRLHISHPAPPIPLNPHRSPKQ